VNEQLFFETNNDRIFGGQFGEYIPQARKTRLILNFFRTWKS